MATIGLASSIATFVDMAFRIVKTSIEIRKSAQGTTEEAHQLSLIVKDIDERVDVFLKSLATKGLRKHDTEIRNIAFECKRVGKELQAILAALAVRATARFPALESGRVAISALLKKEEIRSLTKSLERLEQRIRNHVLETLEGDRYADVMRELKTLKKLHERRGVDNPPLDSLRGDIARLTQSEAENNTALAANLASLTTKLVVLDKNRELYRRQLKIVESLYFPELKRRQSDITDANRKTEKWVFDKHRTTFLDWLESGNGIYWISGLAGSGKSTLMKFICQHVDTKKHLQTWAGPQELHIVDYFFWNRGHTMQKSLHGLMRSLLYQMFRRMPEIILDICGERSGFEAWELFELKETLRLVLEETSLSTKFCFFIDGLDEYNGDVQDLIDIVQFLGTSKHIKICASSRPWSEFEDAFAGYPENTLVLQDFTKDDMVAFIRDEIAENANFKQLKLTDPGCEEIIDEIAARAKGVWLWVFLVSRDIKKALNSKEDYSTLEKILNEVPPDLFAYFQEIIRRITPLYRKDMARIFLATVDAVSPLPLYALSFLDQGNAQRRVWPVIESHVLSVCERWKSKLHNRCGDLLVTYVDSERSPLFLYRIDFLHRTVRDWLREHYYESLKEHMDGEDFEPRMALCEMLLCLLKALPVTNFRESINDIISLVDEVLYYAYELEQSSESTNTRLVEILDDIDTINCYHARGQKNHWTHARDVPRATRLAKYTEGGNYNYLALTIQARLTRYVRTVLDRDPRAIRKNGRPLLDYALRPKRVTPVALPYHTRRDFASVDIEMVELLLERGADPNDRVFLCDNHTVWGLFLLSCFEASNSPEHVSETTKGAWQRATELLIEHGASYDCFGQPTAFTVRGILEQVFGVEWSDEVQRRMDEVQNQRSWSGWALNKLKQVLY